MLRIRNLHHPKLQIDTINCLPGDKWCFFGPLGSGIDEFLQLLEGELQVNRVELLELPEGLTIVSTTRQQQIYEDELRNDDTDFLDRIDPGTAAADFLPTDSHDSELIDLFNMRPHLTTGYRQLSSGQSRKLLLLKALLENNSTIVIDSPYDGLDNKTCAELDTFFPRLQRDNLLLILLIRNIEDIPGWCDHVATFSQGELTYQGKRDEAWESYADTQRSPRTTLFTGTENVDAWKENHCVHKELVRLNHGFAGYGGKNLFTGLNLTINRGDHTLVTGPNGCGKSTLLGIITGDNPKCYANDLTLFGRRRGTGESIWDIKKHMGIVSPEIHRNYRVPGSAMQVVLSGLFDSIGLYTQPSAQQQKIARIWLAAIHAEELAQTPFRNLSYGQQRVLLIARALIKFPPLLVLDEPTQGLDSQSRHALLRFLDRVARECLTTVLYVSHRQDEYRDFFRQHIQLDNYCIDV